MFAIKTFADLIGVVHAETLQDAIQSGLVNDDIRLEEGGLGRVLTPIRLLLFLVFVSGMAKAIIFWLLVHRSQNEFGKRRCRSSKPDAHWIYSRYGECKDAWLNEMLTGGP